MDQQTPKIVVTRLRQTSMSCPSQWVGECTNDGWIFINYRYGMLSVYVDDETLVNMQHGNPANGHMTTDQMIALVQDQLDFSSCQFMERVQPKSGESLQ